MGMSYNRVLFDRATGAAAISYTASEGRRPWRLHSVRLHLSAAATQDTLTISINSNSGSMYDVVLLSQDMTGVADYVWLPNAPVYIDEDDVLTIAWTNTDARTYGLEVVYEVD